MSKSTLSIKCPHCKSKAATRTSREITPVYRELYQQCTNIECGHTWKASLSIVATISPSNLPDPRIVIPLAPKRPALPGQPAVLPANDDERVAANYDGPADQVEAGQPGRPARGSREAPTTALQPAPLPLHPTTRPNALSALRWRPGVEPAREETP